MAIGKEFRKVALKCWKYGWNFAVGNNFGQNYIFWSVASRIYQFIWIYF